MEESAHAGWPAHIEPASAAGAEPATECADAQQFDFLHGLNLIGAGVDERAIAVGRIAAALDRDQLRPEILPADIQRRASGNDGAGDITSQRDRPS